MTTIVFAQEAEVPVDGRELVFTNADSGCMAKQILAALAYAGGGWSQPGPLYSCALERRRAATLEFSKFGILLDNLASTAGALSGRLDCVLAASGGIGAETA